MAFSISHYFKPALLLGLDIGHTVIRVVELSQDADRRYRLERHGGIKLPPGIITDRQIQHPARLAEHIATLTARIGSKRKHVALALPADAVFTRRMQIPAHTGNTALEAIVAAEAAAYLTLAPDQVQTDHQFNDDISGDDKNAEQCEIVLAAARREQIEDRIAAVEAAGLHAAVIDIDLYAAQAACLNMIGAAGISGQSVTALLICDAARTQIAFFDRRQLLYQRELPDFGDCTDMNQIANTVARDLHLAMPAGMTLAHIFLGGDRPVSSLEALASLLRDTATSLAQPEYSPFACSIVQPFAGMASAKAEADNAEAEDAGHAGAYLLACGLAMRRTPR